MTFRLLFSIIIIFNIIFTCIPGNENLEGPLRDKITYDVENIWELEDSDQKPIFTLGELEKKYGPLVKIILQNGKEYIGAFYAENDYLVLTTAQGKLVISADLIRIVLPYKKTNKYNEK